MQDIIQKINKYKLLGRSGSRFPTGLKWEMVKKIKAEKKYIICNASEGEPGTIKDGFILRTSPEKVIEGIRIALKTIDNSSAFIYLKNDYYREFGGKLKTLSQGSAINLFEKKGGYLAGEETVICEAIEGKSLEPRVKPPFPAESGLWGYPTLVNNVETFYAIAKIDQGSYRNERFYSISGDITNPGVYELPEEWTIKQVLEETGNLPDFDFFVQAGGGAAGEILLPKELNKKIEGMATIIVFDKKKTDLNLLMRKWISFFLRENCDKCTPCREGALRIEELLNEKNLDQTILQDLFFVLENTSFCPLGKSIALPFSSLIKKLIRK
jgi:NADH:ubiquinone oxidoreductase subunit F (NADH-binding)